MVMVRPSLAKASCGNRKKSGGLEKLVALEIGKEKECTYASDRGWLDTCRVLSNCSRNVPLTTVVKCTAGGFGRAPARYDSCCTSCVEDHYAFLFLRHCYSIGPGGGA
jgi:hypothetical protein